MTWTWPSPNQVFASAADPGQPPSQPVFRPLVAADLPPFLVKNGPVDDTDFPVPVDGLVGIDVLNGRWYFRYNGDWHYIQQTA